MTAKDRIGRLLRLVELLQSGRPYNTVQLAEACDVSRRTVFRDLRALGDAGFPLHYDTERQCFSLPRRTFLPPTEFTLEESLALFLVCDELGDSRLGIPFQEAARNAAQKIRGTLPAALNEHLGELSRTLSLRLEPQAEVTTDRVREIYQQLTQAAAQRRQVRIVYDSRADGRNIRTLLSPYRLFFNRRSWYVVGRSSLHRQVRTFHLGRIHSAESLNSKFRPPPRFRLDRYFGLAWNMIHEPGTRHEVLIRFQPLVAQNVAEVHWHKTQRLRWNEDGTLDFQVTVSSLKEIIWWILGYGDQAQVLQPAELRRQMSEKIAGMQRLYPEAGDAPQDTR